MTTHTQPLDLQLSRRSIFNVADAAGVQIICRVGSIWITLDNDPRDIVLQAGESFTGTDHRRAIIYALDASQVALSDAQRAVSPRHVAATPVRARSFEEAAA
jgi:Protein of unknown function (DUF2917)